MADKIEVVEIKALYQRDSKNYHLYQIEGSDEVVGSIYVAKVADPFPKKIEVELSK